MLRNIVFFFAILIGLFLGLHHALQSGAFLRYMDSHPHPVWTPRVLFWAGQGYYLFQDLPQAAAYFSRIQNQFPRSREAANASYFYIQVQDDQRTVDRNQLIQLYENYLEKYPNGDHSDLARRRVSSYKSGAQ